MKTTMQSVRVARASYAILVLIFIVHCELPEGCGPGEISTSPYTSMIVDHTEPLSGMIMLCDDFEEFRILFNTPIDRSTFTVSSSESSTDILVYEISNYWSAIDNNIPFEKEQVAPFYLMADSWSCVDHDVCQSNPLAATQLLLYVDPYEITTNTHYLIQILGVCKEGEEQTEPCAENPIMTYDGYALDSTLNIYTPLLHKKGRSDDLKKVGLTT